MDTNNAAARNEITASLSSPDRDDRNGVDRFDVSVAGRPRFLEMGGVGHAPTLIRDVRSGAWYVAREVVTNFGVGHWGLGADVGYGPRGRRKYVRVTADLVGEMRSSANYERYGKPSADAVELKAQRLAFVDLLSGLVSGPAKPATSAELAEAIAAFGDSPEVRALFA